MLVARDVNTRGTLAHDHSRAAEWAVRAVHAVADTAQGDVDADVIL
jgi:hypothetical protein